MNRGRLLVSLALKANNREDDNVEASASKSVGYRTYKTAELLNAAREVIESNKTIYRASKDNNVPWSILKRYLKTNPDIYQQNALIQKQGKPFVLTPELEQKLYHYLIKMQELGFGLTIAQVRTVTFNKWWWTHFRSRYNLTLRVSENLSSYRASCANSTLIAGFYSVLEKLYDKLNIDKQQSTSNIKSAFEKTGIYPFNCTNIPKEAVVPTQLTETSVEMYPLDNSSNSEVNSVTHLENSIIPPNDQNETSVTGPGQSSLILSKKIQEILTLMHTPKPNAKNRKRKSDPSAKHVTSPTYTENHMTGISSKVEKVTKNLFSNQKRGKQSHAQPKQISKATEAMCQPGPSGIKTKKVQRTEDDWQCGSCERLYSDDVRIKMVQDGYNVHFAKERFMKNANRRSQATLEFSCVIF
ncbi:hypothetical protein ILUMI_18277, partial [Ignelater luminosus]